MTPAPADPAPVDGFVFAPGRVNLIGDHTDYTGGLALPMAIQLGTTLRFTRGGEHLRLTSADAPGTALIACTVRDPASTVPAWARGAAGVVAELRPDRGLTGVLASTLPIGAGLASSAALEIAVALAFGDHGDLVAIASRAQRAEQRGTGVPCGIMDQLTCLAGEEGAALLLDCRALTWQAVAMPADVAVHVVHCGVPRALARSGYATRRAQCEAAAVQIGPLAAAGPDDVRAIRDPTLRRRARHVVSENDRVRACADALRAGDLRAAGLLFGESHRSLRDDFAVSTPELDALVERLARTPGVYGARLTGGGFGGCAVALVDVSTDAASIGGWRVRPSAGARLQPAG